MIDAIADRSYVGIDQVAPCARRDFSDRLDELMKRIEALFALAGWGNKWGNMPHRFQPIPVDLDLPETA